MMPLQQPMSPTTQAPHQQFVVSPTAAGQVGPPSPEWHGATCVAGAPQPSYPPPAHPPYQADAIASQPYGQFIYQQPPPQAYASYPAPQSPQHHLPPQQQGAQPLNSPQHMLQVQQQQQTMSSPEPLSPQFMTPPPSPPPQGFAPLQHQQQLDPAQQVLSPENLRKFDQEAYGTGGFSRSPVLDAVTPNSGSEATYNDDDFRGPPQALDASLLRCPVPCSPHGHLVTAVGCVQGGHPCGVWHAELDTVGGVGHSV